MCYWQSEMLDVGGPHGRRCQASGLPHPLTAPSVGQDGYSFSLHTPRATSSVNGLAYDTKGLVDE